MKVNNIPTRSIRPVAAGNGERVVEIIDQTALPYTYRIKRINSLDDAALAIRTMEVRGAPLIGVTAAYGLALAMSRQADDASLSSAITTLAATRPTAVNLHWALHRMQTHLATMPPTQRAEAAWREAGAIAEEDVRQCRSIGEHGLAIFRSLQATKEAHTDRLNIMTHCNAGWLATVDYGTALAPIYTAFDAGIDLHVWVSETRPRNQGLLTAWELTQHGVPHTVIADNAAGLLMQRGAVDAVIVGADRIAANGDVANKVGTYLKALAAHQSGIPFYVAAPRSTIDFACSSWRAIPIEERNGEELRIAHGLGSQGETATIRLLPTNEAIANPAFDLTPAEFINAIITERGCCPASAKDLRALYAEEHHA